MKVRSRRQMKILTMGDPERLNPLIRFECRRCGCEFVANALECEQEQDQYNDSVYRYDCPCCKSAVHSTTEYKRKAGNLYD